MAWNINRVILVGRLSNDVELKYIPSGKAVAKFGIAVGGRPRQDGTESVSFFNVVVWDKPAETCAKFLAKGKQVAIDGHLEQRTWTVQDGSKRSAVEIIAERIEFLQPKPASGDQKPADDTPPLEDNFYDNTGFNPSPVDPNEPGF